MTNPPRAERLKAAKEMDGPDFIRGPDSHVTGDHLDSVRVSTFATVNRGGAVYVMYTVEATYRFKVRDAIESEPEP